MEFVHCHFELTREAIPVEWGGKDDDIRFFEKGGEFIKVVRNGTGSAFAPTLVAILATFEIFATGAIFGDLMPLRVGTLDESIRKFFTIAVASGTSGEYKNIFHIFSDLVS